jgi:hypothetical protein
MDERIARKQLLKQHGEQIFLQRIAVTRQAKDNAQAAQDNRCLLKIHDYYGAGR